MLQSLMNTLFGCTHHHTTFPLTRKSARFATPAPAPRLGTYVVCLDCGKEFAYDWETMRVGQPVVPHAPAATAQPILR